jgi:ribonuclease HI
MIQPEFISRTWTEPSVQGLLDDGVVGVSLETTHHVGWEMAKYDLAIFSDGASFRGRAACGAVAFNGVTRDFLKAGGGALGRRLGALTAEKEGIRLAIKMAKESGARRAVVFTDSLESLRSLRSAEVRSAVDRATKRELSEVDFRLDFQHVNGHAGVYGNELANVVAKRFTDRAYHEALPSMGTAVEEVRGLWLQDERRKRLDELQALASGSSQVKHALEFAGLEENPVFRTPYHLNRREEMVYNRLRVKGWSVLPQGNKAREGTPDHRGCPWCGGTADATHVLEECASLSGERLLHLSFDSNEPILQNVERVAPFIRSLVGKLCQ